MTASLVLTALTATPLSNLLTASRLKTARRCKRKHQLEYEMGFKTVTDFEELFFGDCVHKGLEAWWLAVKAGNPNRLEDALLALAGLTMDPFDRARAEVMLTGYEVRWGAEADDFEVLGVECRFHADLVNPESGRSSRSWKLGGKLDVVVRRRSTGRLIVIEHKTSGEDITPGGTYHRRLRMDAQVSVYFDGAAAAFDQAVDECLYDVLGKPRLKPLKATPPEKRKIKKDGTPYADTRLEDETPLEFKLRCTEAMGEAPEKYFQRFVVVRLEDDLDDSRTDSWQVGQELNEARRLNRWPRNPEACEQYGRMCAFFDVCCRSASLDDPRLFLRRTNVHPELEGVEVTLPTTRAPAAAVANQPAAPKEEESHP